MNIVQKSIFNLIEIFRTLRKPVIQTISVESNCEQKHNYDFYCDAEKPFIEQFR